MKKKKKKKKKNLVGRSTDGGRGGGGRKKTTDEVRECGGISLISDVIKKKCFVLRVAEPKQKKRGILSGLPLRDQESDGESVPTFFFFCFKKKIPLFRGSIRIFFFPFFFLFHLVTGKQKRYFFGKNALICPAISANGTRTTPREIRRWKGGREREREREKPVACLSS